MHKNIKPRSPSRQLLKTVNFAFMKIFDFLVKIVIFWAFLLFLGRFASCIPRKIMLSPYAKKCIVFYHIFRTKCWYWANTSTLSLSACKQSAGIGSIPALCGLIFHTFVISQFFNSFLYFLIFLKNFTTKNDYKDLKTVF